MDNKSTARKNKLTLALIFLLFLVPILISWWFLNYSNVVNEGKKSNYGALITPARSLPESILFNASAIEKQRNLQGKWSLVYIVSGQCADGCKKILYSLHQIEQAMGKDSLRVQRVALLTHPENTLDILANYPGQWLLQLAKSDLDAFLNRFRLDDVTDPVMAGYVYIIDPLGNLMMFYPADFDPYGVLRDLRRLLKASQIG